MNRAVVAIALLLLVGCRGSSPSLFENTSTQPQRDSSDVELSLRATDEGGYWRLELTAPAAQDLYQIAATLRYDHQAYDILAVEAGGGLGGPQESYFFSGEPVPGELAFAYTRRYFGPGASGPVDLLSVKITPLDHFTLSDFELDTSPGALIVRDSAKRELVVQVTRGGTP